MPRKSYHSTSGNSSYKIWVASWIVFSLTYVLTFILGVAVGVFI